MSERPGEMDERDVDARFASIVAGWDGTAAPPADPAAGAPGDPTEPATGDRPEDPEPGPPAAASSAPSPADGLVPASSWRVVVPPTPTDEGSAATVDDDGPDEHFEPPAVELPPQEDLHFWGAVVGLVAGPLCLVYVAMARPFHSTRWFLAGLALSLLGFALLVLRQPRDRDIGDDGARV